MALVDIDPSIPDPELVSQTRPRYDLDAEELALHKVELIEQVRAQYGEHEDVYAVWINPNNPLANIVRTEEAARFPEIPDIMKDCENESMFLALVDTRDGKADVVRAFRITGSSLDVRVIAEVEEAQGVAVELATNTGLPLVDDIINSNQGLTTEEFIDYYKARGVELGKCISVETNFKIEQAGRYNGLPLSQVGYIALFKLIEGSDGLTVDEAAVFAHLNKPAVESLGFIGLEYEGIAGREELRTPTVKDGKPGFDLKYKPVAIPATERNLEIFSSLTSLAAPQMYI